MDGEVLETSAEVIEPVVEAVEEAPVVDLSTLEGLVDSLVDRFADGFDSVETAIAGFTTVQWFTFFILLLILGVLLFLVFAVAMRRF